MELKPALYPAEKAAKPTTVLVTGATGFLAGPLVQRLLAAGHTVHATARRPEDEKTVAHLKQLPGAGQRLKLFKADLLSEGAFTEAMQGCTVVFHTASPFVLSAGYGAAAQKNLIDPAVKGTENVLKSVEATPSVKRVVLTSSNVAVNHRNDDLPQGQLYTEDNWNTKGSLYDIPYNLSKTVAEKKAWELAEQATHWDLVVCNPALIMGPPLSSRADGESINFMKMFFDGKLSPVAPRMGFGVVDVRDVAAAHCLAAFTPTAKGRHLLAPSSAWITDMLAVVHSKYPKVPMNAVFAPKWLLLAVGPALGLSRDMVRAYVGTLPRFSVAKAQKDLGIQFLPLEETILDMADACLELGIIKPK